MFYGSHAFAKNMPMQRVACFISKPMQYDYSVIFSWLNSYCMRTWCLITWHMPFQSGEGTLALWIQYGHFGDKLCLKGIHFFGRRGRNLYLIYKWHFAEQASTLISDNLSGKKLAVWNREREKWFHLIYFCVVRIRKKPPAPVCHCGTFQSKQEIFLAGVLSRGFNEHACSC